MRLVNITRAQLHIVNKKLFLKFLSKRPGATNYDEAMKWAAARGHEKIVNQMLKFLSKRPGATDYNRAMRETAIGGHENIVQLIQSYIDNK